MNDGRTWFELVVDRPLGFFVLIEHILLETHYVSNNEVHSETKDVKVKVGINRRKSRLKGTKDPNCA